MRWPWQRRCEVQEGRPSEEATEAAQQAQRALRDFQNLARHADEVTKELSRTRERNHIAAALVRAIRGA